MIDFGYFTQHTIEPLLKSHPNLALDGLMPPGYRSSSDPDRIGLLSVRGLKEINLAALWFSMLRRGKTAGVEITSNALRLLAEPGIGWVMNGSLIAGALLNNIAVHDTGTLNPVLDVDLSRPNKNFDALIRPALIAAGEEKCVDGDGNVTTRRALLKSKPAISQPDCPLRAVFLANMFMSLKSSTAGGAL